VAHLKIARTSSTTVTRSGIKKAIFVKTAPLTWTPALVTLSEIRDTTAHMRQFYKIRSQYEHTRRVWVGFKCATLCMSVMLTLKLFPYLCAELAENYKVYWHIGGVNVPLDKDYKNVLIYIFLNFLYNYALTSYSSLCSAVHYRFTFLCAFETWIHLKSLYHKRTG
jgi:hypothetical protein